MHFDFEGYDTSPFWDDDGTSYVVGSHAYKVEYVIDIDPVHTDADSDRPGNHLAKVNLTTGKLQSNWTNLWAGTGGLVKHRGPSYAPLLTATRHLKGRISIARMGTIT